MPFAVCHTLWVYHIFWDTGSKKACFRHAPGYGKNYLYEDVYHLSHRTGRKTDGQTVKNQI